MSCSYKYTSGSKKGTVCANVAREKDTLCDHNGNRYSGKYCEVHQIHELWWPLCSECNQSKVVYSDYKSGLCFYCAPAEEEKPHVLSLEEFPTLSSNPKTPTKTAWVKNQIPKNKKENEKEKKYSTQQVARLVNALGLLGIRNLEHGDTKSVDDAHKKMIMKLESSKSLVMKYMNNEDF